MCLQRHFGLGLEARCLRVQVNEVHLIVIATISNEHLIKDGWREGMAVRRCHNTYAGDTFELDVDGPFESYATSSQAFREIVKRFKTFGGVKFRVKSFGAT